MPDLGRSVQTSRLPLNLEEVPTSSAVDGARRSPTHLFGCTQQPPHRAAPTSRWRLSSPDVLIVYGESLVTAVFPVYRGRLALLRSVRAISRPKRYTLSRIEDGRITFGWRGRSEAKSDQRTSRICGLCSRCESPFQAGAPGAPRLRPSPAPGPPATTAPVSPPDDRGCAGVAVGGGLVGAVAV